MNPKTPIGDEEMGVCRPLPMLSSLSLPLPLSLSFSLSLCLSPSLPPSLSPSLSLSTAAATCRSCVVDGCLSCHPTKDTDYCDVCQASWEQQEAVTREVGSSRKKRETHLPPTTLRQTSLGGDILKTTSLDLRHNFLSREPTSRLLPIQVLQLTHIFFWPFPAQCSWARTLCASSQSRAAEDAGERLPPSCGYLDAVLTRLRRIQDTAANPQPARGSPIGAPAPQAEGFGGSGEPPVLPGSGTWSEHLTGTWTYVRAQLCGPLG